MKKLLAIILVLLLLPAALAVNDTNVSNTSIAQKIQDALYKVHSSYQIFNRIVANSTNSS